MGFVAKRGGMAWNPSFAGSDEARRTELLDLPVEQFGIKLIGLRLITAADFEVYDRSPHFLFLLL